MNFGDILKDWDALRGRREDTRDSAKKPQKAPPAGPEIKKDKKKPGIHELQSQWIRDYGVVDKDGDEESKVEYGLHRYYTKKEVDRMPVDAVLDLHGMTVLSAEDALDDFFTLSESRKLRKVLVIHGKGLHSERGSVLADVVRLWLERRPSAGRTGFADSDLGGGGATWVLLKYADQRSR